MAEIDPAALAGAGGIMAVIAAFFMIFLVVALIAYVYFALVYMTIAKKLGYDKPWLAWIPLANMFLVPILAKKHWAWGFILLVPIVNFVFMIIWHWTIFERRKYPGWLSLIYIAMIIPVLNYVAGLGLAIIMGLVAWADRK